MLSSKKLLNNLCHSGVRHLDTTYKITINGFRLIVFGISDLCGQLHLCLMITSHETEADFDFFFKGLIDQCNLMDIEFNPAYIMQDACRASYNSTKNHLPDTKVLMCYFHDKDNIKKRLRHLLEEEVFLDLKDDLSYIHMYLSESEFKEKLKSFKTKYQINYPELYDYINEQWFENVFNKWQIYQNEPGYANSNSNVESFNNVIKRDFTSRRRLSIKAALEKIGQVIVYNSTKGPQFETRPKFDNKIKSIAEKFSNSNYKVIRKNKLISYIGKNNKFQIRG